MKVTEVRIKLTGDSDDRLLAFCSITLDDCFVVRDLKIIDGSSGPFVAMPSRKLTGHCGQCRSKNHLRSNFCNQCGNKLPRQLGNSNRESTARLYADIAHPINASCREMIQQSVIQEFEEEVARSKIPGYQPRFDDDFDRYDEGEDFQRSASSATRGETASAERGETAADRQYREDQAGAGPRAPHSESRKSKKTVNQDQDDDQFGAGILD